MKLHGLYGFAQVGHALAQFLLNAAAFLLPHLIQAIERFARSGHHGGCKRSVLRISGRIERAGDSQDGVEIRLGGDGKLTRRRSKRRDVSADQRAIQRKRLAASALQTQRDFDMPAGNLCFEQAPQLHFQRVGARGQTKMQIEKTMVHRFQREREGKLPVAGSRAGRGRTDAAFSLAYEFAFDLRKSRHRAERHNCFPSIQSPGSDCRF